MDATHPCPCKCWLLRKFPHREGRACQNPLENALSCQHGLQDEGPEVDSLGGRVHLSSSNTLHPLVPQYVQQGMLPGVGEDPLH